MKKLRVVVLMGGRSPEHEVSLISGREVVRHLDPRKYEILPLVIAKNGRRWQLKTVEQILLSRAQPKSQGKNLVLKGQNMSLELITKRADVVFIAIHGPFGEDGTVQGLLELAGVPYTGAGVLASALGMDKPLFRKVMMVEKIPIPNFLVIEKGEKPQKIWQKFKLPVVIKPSSQGSSVGVSLVRGKKDLELALEKAFSFGPQILVDEYLTGVEVTCGVLGNKNPFALPVLEIVPKNEFFDYEAKYVSGKSEEIVPARISANLTQEVQDMAVRVYKAINCRGFGRVDMIISNEKPYVLEINTIPGLTPNSLFPKEAAAAGISFSELVDRLINLALEGN